MTLVSTRSVVSPDKARFGTTRGSARTKLSRSLRTVSPLRGGDRARPGAVAGNIGFVDIDAHVHGIGSAHDDQGLGNGAGQRELAGVDVDAQHLPVDRRIDRPQLQIGLRQREGCPRLFDGGKLDGDVGTTLGFVVEGEVRLGEGQAGRSLGISSFGGAQDVAPSRDLACRDGIAGVEAAGDPHHVGCVVLFRARRLDRGECGLHLGF
jgi:hypothetical protein